jgi:hypothetical protein
MTAMTINWRRRAASAVRGDRTGSGLWRVVGRIVLAKRASGSASIRSVLASCPNLN